MTSGDDSTAVGVQKAEMRICMKRFENLYENLYEKIFIQTAAFYCIKH
jgi:hypothetical protein